MDLPENNTSRTQSSFGRILTYSFIFLICTPILIYVIGGTSNELKETLGVDTSSQEDTDCNISGILLRGTLDTYAVGLEEEDGSMSEDVTSSDDILFAIKEAKEDTDIRALLLEVDSYGGSPVAAEEIAVAIKNFGKPTYAHIRGAGASAAYWAASGADTIFASKNSDIGSIGATMSYLDYSQKNKNDGIFYQEISSGKYKDSGSPEKSLSEEEKTLFQRDIDIIAENFIQTVAENRNLSIEEVKKLADGSTMLGKRALEKGLIDVLAVMDEVHTRIETDLGEDISICWN